VLPYWKAEGKLDQSIIHFAQEIMKDIFGSKPNRRNLKLFFQLPVIQALWWPIDDPNIVQGEQADLFVHSNVVIDILDRQTLVMKENIV